MTFKFLIAITVCLLKILFYFHYNCFNVLEVLMDTVDIQAVESKLSDVTVTAIPMAKPPQPNQNHAYHRDTHTPNSTNSASASVGLASPQTGLSKYAQLLNVIEEMGKEVRPTYAGSRSSAERLKRSIVSARILVRECLIETERSARQ